MEGLAVPDIVTAWVHLAALAFARVGTAVLILPGLGDTQIPPRIRIALGLVVTLALLPALPLPDPPAQTTALALLLGGGGGWRRCCRFGLQRGGDGWLHRCRVVLLWGGIC